MQLSRAPVFILLLLSTFALAQVSSSDSKSPQPPGVNDKADSNSPAVTSSNFVPDAAGMLSEEQMRNVLRISADNDIENDKRQRNYTYIEREEEHKLDGKGRVKSTEVRTSEILMIYGEQVERLISKNDRPLSRKDAAKEDEKIQKIIDKREHESDKDRKRRMAREEKDREEGRKFVSEVADAYNFHFLGTEKLGGRDTYVIDAEPRPGFQPRMKYANILPKFRFRAWIDQHDLQWAKLDAVAIDTVSFGLFLARIHKGTRVVLEQTRINDEVWLPKQMDIRVDARVALLKNFNLDQQTTYRDYKKFRTDTKIVGVGEVPQ